MHEGFAVIDREILRAATKRYHLILRKKRMSIVEFLPQGIRFFS